MLGFSCPSCPCGMQLQMEMARVDALYKIMSQHSASSLINTLTDNPFDVTPKPVMYAVYQRYLVFT